MQKAIIIADKKKLQSRIEALINLVTKGDKKKEISGSNEMLEKIYTALKDQRGTSLNKVTYDAFKDKESAFLKADNYYIGKNRDLFFLFKGSTYKTLEESSKKNLTQTVKEMNEKYNAVGSDSKDEALIDKLIEDVPFVELKSLSKTDIVNKLYEDAKDNDEIKKAICDYTGESKFVKKILTTLSYGDIDYMVTTNEKYVKAFNDTKISDIVKAYNHEGSNTEIRLTRKADKKEISSEELKEFSKDLDSMETRASKVLNEMSEWKKAERSDEKSSALLRLTSDMMVIRTELKSMEYELDKAVPISKEDELEIARGVSDNPDGDLTFVNKDIIEASEDCPAYHKKIGLKRENEIVSYLTEDEKGIKMAEELGIGLESKVKIINYGAFVDDKPENALENLLLYAKHLNEMVDLTNDNSFNEAQTNDGNFAI